jgi:hypothetical protein
LSIEVAVEHVRGSILHHVAYHPSAGGAGRTPPLQELRLGAQTSGVFAPRRGGGGPSNDAADAASVEQLADADLDELVHPSSVSFGDAAGLIFLAIAY